MGGLGESTARPATTGRAMSVTASRHGMVHKSPALGPGHQDIGGYDSITIVGRVSCTGTWEVSMLRF